MTTAQGPDWEVPAPPPLRTKRFWNRNANAPTSPPAQKEIEAGQAPITTTSSPKPSFADRFNRMVPPNRSYFGRSRRTFLWAVVALVLLLILILGLGLGFGLKKNSSSSHSLPLPSNKQTFTGDLTYYAPGLGACGIVSSASDSICAVSHIVFDAAQTGSNPNANPLCGKMIRITRYDTSVGANRSADVTVVDRCVGCQPDDLDVTITVFDSLADEAQGRVVGSWAWLD